jgi:hypothetical protein
MNVWVVYLAVYLGSYLCYSDQTSRNQPSIFALLSNNPPVNRVRASSSLCEVIGSALIAFCSFAVVSKVVDVCGCKLAIDVGCLERIDLGDLEKSLWCFVPGIYIRRLWFAFAGLLSPIVLELGQLVENLWRDGGTVTSVLTRRHSLLRRDESG